MNEVLSKIVEEDYPGSKEERKELAIKLLISFCKDLRMSGTDTARKLQEKFYLNGHKVDEYMKKYWKEL